jgi:hypothetical protein
MSQKGRDVDLESRQNYLNKRFGTRVWMEFQLYDLSQLLIKVSSTAQVALPDGIIQETMSSGEKCCYVDFPRFLRATNPLRSGGQVEFNEIGSSMQEYAFEAYTSVLSSKDFPIRVRDSPNYTPTIIATTVGARFGIHLYRGN